ncbi:uncharacterized protein LOC130626107 isoform X2 [Hydractinia symbiolongicarpus]|uniref:uncharacterized protein LOC130626107 isoform X2 n=1 Tax=Hydractinia symbiolongicarpus TaxID=13093 RepID=UPI00254FBC4C|nr:uncharacterized protein LOC130626107 isoform X2 [Hydractinia symbiolongicarpus]
MFSKKRTSLLRRAEASAEVNVDGTDEIVKVKKPQNRNKKRNKKMKTKFQSEASKQRQKRKKENKIQELLKQHLGATDCVTSQIGADKKKFYVYKCPVCKSFISAKLQRHLIESHEYSYDDARMASTKMRLLYLWCHADKHSIHLPLPCETCHEWHSRLDRHLKTHPVHKTLKSEEVAKMVEDARAKYWVKGYSSHPKPGDSAVPDVVEEQNEYEEEIYNNEEVLIRLKPKPLESLSPSIDYIPPAASRLSQQDRKTWNIKFADYFTIYFQNSEDLLDAFEQDLLTSGHTKANSVQHRNHVTLMWSAVDRELNMFPVNPMSNIHLFRDFYHRPTFKSIGKHGGVQASTLSSRYVSLGFFIQYLRRNQVFAGMSRVQLQILSDTIKDFNKQLNPFIKQRKVQVRRLKVKHLLHPQHFINFGQSEYVQTLISKAENRDKHCQYTKRFAQNFRDYLIASLVIGNGLRASNIMNLRLNDFENFQVVKGYEGHKVLTNDNYKTSTIYGEKFIVMPDALHQHFLFYQKFLRPIISKSKSEKAFLPSSGQPQMSQTNVSSSLTSSFSHAKVLKPNEYHRVSCTRIRCGLATFACNDGGFESAFFAKHFMKNREHTTDLHYNLLSNRRHALNIAMKLYESFNGADGIEIHAEPQDVQLLVTKLKNSTSNINKENVIQWLLKNDPSISKHELSDMKAILEEVNRTHNSIGNTSTFYSKKQQDSSSECSSTEDTGTDFEKATVDDDKVDEKRNGEKDVSDNEVGECNTEKGDNDCSRKKNSYIPKIDILEEYGVSKPGDFIIPRQLGARVGYLVCAFFCKQLIIRNDYDNSSNVETFTNAEVSSRLADLPCERLREIFETRDLSNWKFYVLALRTKYWRCTKEGGLNRWRKFLNEAIEMVEACKKQCMAADSTPANFSTTDNKNDGATVDDDKVDEKRDGEKDVSDNDVEASNTEKGDNDGSHRKNSYIPNAAVYKEGIENGRDIRKDAETKGKKRRQHALRIMPTFVKNVTEDEKDEIEDSGKDVKSTVRRCQRSYIPPPTCSMPSFMNDPNVKKEFVKPSEVMDVYNIHFTREKMSQSEATGERYCVTATDPRESFVCKKIDDFIGRGVFALKTFLPNDFLLQYPGELVDAKVGAERELLYEKEGRGCYLFFFNFNGRKLCVDATNEHTRYGKYVNDSGKSYANSAVRVKYFAGSPYLCLFAIKKIDIGTEIRYSYGETYGLSWRKLNNYKRPFTLEMLDDATVGDAESISQ